ncbi:MAG: L,D-transpeptidase family protein [Planctomycetes bacterium]|nr:L,D-transpeptidase family protein [Planctomycetota bacterium]
MTFAVVATWWVYGRSGAGTPAGVAATLALSTQPGLTTDRPEIVPEDPPPSGVVEKGAAPEPRAPDVPTTDAARIRSLMAAGKDAVARNDLIAARTHFSDAMALGASERDRSTLRAELTRIGNETIFSPRLVPGDPLVDRYVIKPGDSLAKIAKANKVSADLLAAINDIRDKNRIRAGQSIKVIKGPFHAVIEKSSYSLDVFLESTFVKHFRVGLGADGSTPRGEWRIATKLENPTYYPPRSGRVIASDDPQNPLGERWIGLAGVSGEAVGQFRYGIHGTIEPDSIGKSVSLGCIRMYNEDVEALYTYLVEKHSSVTVKD